MSEPSKAAVQVIVFLPFLRMESGHCVAGVEFLPLRDAEKQVAGNPGERVAAATVILKGYTDRHGKPFDNCVVATIPGRGWDLTESDSPDITWAASLLFLASWARNDYFPRFCGPYVNSSSFRVVGQKYTGDTPHYIAIVARRRDGSSWDGGYKHGEFKFSLPTQCSLREPADVEESLLLTALDKAVAANSVTIDRLRFALPFVSLANTDDDLMAPSAEAILMGSAFRATVVGRRQRVQTRTEVRRAVWSLR